MHTIEWSEEYAVGIEEVDAQHQALLGMINALSANINTDQEPDVTRDLLFKLSDYTRFHFSLEERLMDVATIDPDFVLRHRNEHTYFCGVLKDFIADFTRGKSRISNALLEYLLHWLLHHIMVIDNDMARQLKAEDPHDPRATEVLAAQTTVELSDSERHLLAEAQQATGELEAELRETKQALEEAQTELAAAKRMIAELTRQ